MNKEFIPYEQALELKELGFEATPIGGFKQDAVFYYEKGELYYDYRPMYSSTAHEGQILAPLYQQAFRWFRENGYISQITYDNFHNSHGYQIDGKYHTAEESFLEYESAEFTCLKKLIEIVKTYNQNK